MYPRCHDCGTSVLIFLSLHNTRKKSGILAATIVDAVAFTQCHGIALRVEWEVMHSTENMASASGRRTR